METFLGCSCDVFRGSKRRPKPFFKEGNIYLQLYNITLICENIGHLLSERRFIQHGKKNTSLREKMCFDCHCSIEAQSFYITLLYSYRFFCERGSSCPFSGGHDHSESPVLKKRVEGSLAALRCTDVSKSKCFQCVYASRNVMWSVRMCNKTLFKSKIGIIC